MKRIATVVAALTLVASAASAAGIDLSVNGCPGNPTVTGGEVGPLDCAGGVGVAIVATLVPVEAIPDLIGL